jgi:two-component system C4-dicarboxylate transport response regulator DctD
LADIILVEDDTAIGRAYATALRMSGHVVRLAGSAEVFETELAQAVPDLLLLDIGLPGSDGLAILRQLRTDPRTAELKVAVVSNYTDRTIVHEALSLGIVEYAEKASLTPSQLPGQVRRWLADSR